MAPGRAPRAQRGRALCFQGEEAKERGGKREREKERKREREKNEKRNAAPFEKKKPPTPSAHRRSDKKKPLKKITQVRELRWNANFSTDKSEVTFDRLFYNEAYMAEKSCPGCSLDNDRIVTVNRGYLAVLAFYGGSELPLVLPGAPAALSGVLGAFQAGIVAGGAAQTPPIAYDDLTAKYYARLQWSQCFLWTPDPSALLEYCAWATAQGLGPEAMLDPTAGERVLDLLGNPLDGDAQ